MECVVFVFSALLLGGMSGQPGIFTRDSADIPAKCNQLPGLRWVGGHFTKNTACGVKKESSRRLGRSRAAGCDMARTWFRRGSWWAYQLGFVTLGCELCRNRGVRSILVGSETAGQYGVDFRCQLDFWRKSLQFCCPILIWAF